MTRILTLTLNPALDISTETETVGPDRKLRCAAPRIDPGGGGVNVSRAIASLGGASLPLVPALGMWVVAAERTNYSALLFVVGLLYLLLALCRRSALSAAAAVVAAAPPGAEAAERS